jgi:hypothetical protein
MDTTAITPVTIETPEAATMRKAALASLLAMLAAVAKAVLRLVRRILGIGSEAATELKGDAIALARGARRGIEATGRVVGTGLEGPARVLDATASAVGATLGALLPQRPVTPADVARGALARDDRRQGVAAAVPHDVAEAPLPAPALTLPILVQAHAKASIDPTGRAAEGLIPLDDRHAAWIRSLDLHERKLLAWSSARVIERHLDATHASHRILGVSAVPSPAQYADARSRVDRALAMLEATPERPAMSRADAYRSLGIGELDEEEEAVEMARFAR